MFYQPFELLGPEESRHHADFFCPGRSPLLFGPDLREECPRNITLMISHFLYIYFKLSKTFSFF